MADLDREGTFRARPNRYELVKGATTQSVGVRFDFLCLSMQNGDEWDEWEEFQHYIEGTQWFFGKDGKPIRAAVESLASIFGWTGDLDFWREPGKQLPSCQIVVKYETYNNVTALKVQYINDYDRGGGLSDESLSKMKTAHGSALRAIAGDVVRKASVPAPPPSDDPPTRIDPETGREILF